MWFVGSGFAVLLIGGLNVVTANLEQRTFAEVRGLRTLTLIADACGLALGLIHVLLTRGKQPQGPVLVALFVVAAFGQLRRVSDRPRNTSS